TEPVELVERGAQKLRLAGIVLDPGPERRQIALGRAPLRPRVTGTRDQIAEIGPGVEQVAMPVGIDQGAFVMLAVNLDQAAPDAAHERNTRRLIIDEDAAASVGALHAAQGQLYVAGERFRGQDAKC